MTQLTDFAFNLLNEDEFYDLFCADFNTQHRINTFDFDTNVAEQINELMNETDFNNGNVTQYPASKYITEQQFKSLEQLDDIFSLLHLNIRSINKNLKIYVYF